MKGRKEEVSSLLPGRKKAEMMEERKRCKGRYRERRAVEMNENGVGMEVEVVEGRREGRRRLQRTSCSDQGTHRMKTSPRAPFDFPFSISSVLASCEERNEEGRGGKERETDQLDVSISFLPRLPSLARPRRLT